MTLIKQSTGHKQPKDMAQNPSYGFRSKAELGIRKLLEAWIRERSSGRIVHELTVFDGQSRADVAAFEEADFTSFEIKSQHDSPKRLIHQCGLFHLVSPTLWIVCSDHHVEDAELVRFLLPKVGILTFPTNPAFYNDDVGDELTVLYEAVAHTPHKESLIKILWRDEMFNSAVRHGFQPTSRATCSSLMKQLVTLTDEEAMKAVCYELRRRVFAFRADDNDAWAYDPPVTGAMS